MRKLLVIGLVIISCILFTFSNAYADTLESFLKRQDEVFLWYVVRDLGSSVDAITHQVVYASDKKVDKIYFLRFDDKTRNVRVLDSVVVPAGRLETQSCAMNEKLDGEILALFNPDNQESEKLMNPLRAWRASRVAERFEVIPSLNNVVCFRRSDD